MTETNITQAIAGNTLRTTLTETTTTIGRKNTQILDPKTTQITNNLIKTITTDRVKTLISLDLGTNSYQNRSRIYSQLPHRKNSRRSDRQKYNHRGSTPKHRRQLNQILTTK